MLWRFAGDSEWQGLCDDTRATLHPCSTLADTKLSGCQATLEIKQLKSSGSMRD